MTKVTILGEEPKEKKRIQFIQVISTHTVDVRAAKASQHPNEWHNVELVSRGHQAYYDIMFAFNDDRRDGCLYLGHFNDGIV